MAASRPSLASFRTYPPCKQTCPRGAKCVCVRASPNSYFSLPVASPNGLAALVTFAMLRCLHRTGWRVSYTTQRALWPNGAAPLSTQKNINYMFVQNATNISTTDMCLNSLNRGTQKDTECNHFRQPVHGNLRVEADDAIA